MDTQLSFLVTPAARVVIGELPASEQPHERLSHCGPTALSAAELLAILLSLRDLGSAETLLARYDGLVGLARAPLAELSRHYRGIGPGKARQLQAAFELGRRVAAAPLLDRRRIHTPADAAALLLADMGTLEQEELRTIIVDTKNQVLKVHTVYKGSLNTVVLRRARSSARRSASTRPPSSLRTTTPPAMLPRRPKTSRSRASSSRRASCSTSTSWTT